MYIRSIQYNTPPQCIQYVTSLKNSAVKKQFKEISLEKMYSVAGANKNCGC